MKEWGIGGFLSQTDSLVCGLSQKSLDCGGGVRRAYELVLFIPDKFSIQGLFNEPHAVEGAALLNHSSVKINCFQYLRQVSIGGINLALSVLNCFRIPLHKATFQSPCYVPRSSDITGFSYFSVTTQKRRKTWGGKQLKPKKRIKVHSRDWEIVA